LTTLIDDAAKTGRGANAAAMGYIDANALLATTFAFPSPTRPLRPKSPGARRSIKVVITETFTSEAKIESNHLAEPPPLSVPCHYAGDNPVTSRTVRSATRAQWRAPLGIVAAVETELNERDTPVSPD
jgi:hypothetical protein